MKSLERYLPQLSDCFLKVEAKKKNGKSLAVEDAVQKIVAQVLACAKKRNKVMIVGNGGSAAIASHTAVDLLKNAEVPCIAFNDASFLTCLSNDLGYEAVFALPIERLSKAGDILIAISSSGKSPNILKAVETAKKKTNFIVTFSGFLNENPLRSMGDINFYVPSFSYGFVEVTHLALCHWIVDSIMDQKARRN